MTHAVVLVHGGAKDPPRGTQSRAHSSVQPQKLHCQEANGTWLLAFYWCQSAKPDEITAMFDHMAPMVASVTISTPVVATHGFEQVAEAVAKAGETGGKVLFTPAGLPQ
jgi:hypothetical protein